jgi:hypothetical protein
VCLQDIAYNADEKNSQPSGGGVCETACVPVLVNICNALISGADVLNEYDGVCGDGDCGRVMHAAATHILQQVENGVFSQATDRASFCFQVRLL